MAEQQGSDAFGGYDDEFVDAIEDDLVCPVCHLPLKMPVQTRECGHRFCELCLERHFMRRERDGQQLTCSLDQNVLIRDKDIFPDKATERNIRSFVIKCPRGCQWTGELRSKEISSHTENNCSLAPIPCPYADMGCNKKAPQPEIECHLNSDTRMHLDLVCTKLKNTEEELRNTKEQLKDFKETTKRLEERIIARDTKPVYMWKIDGFQEILEQARAENVVRIESQPFYTGECGYKVRLRLYPNGFLTGRNTHLSVFFLLMKGDFDSILKWPFDKRVTFSLIDQYENLNDRENIARTIPFHSKQQNWNSRPREVNNTARGFADFVQHNVLMKRCYILDDSIFIQAKFEAVGH